MTPDQSPGGKAALSQGWRVVGGSFVSMMVVTGFFTYSVSLLVVPVREEFGVGVEQVMYSLTLGTFIGLFATPVFGALIDRVSIRGLMTWGCVATAGGLWLLSHSTSIIVFNVLFAVTMSVSNGMTGSMASSAAVSRWFSRNRGRALGIAAMGTSVGGILLPALITWWLELSSWRGALQYLSLSVLLMMTPFVWFTIRSHPRELGMTAEGLPETDPVAGTGSVALGMGLIVRMPAFWLIGLSLGLLFSAYSATLANLAPYATDLGIPEVRASSLIMILALAGLVGKLGFGYAADHISHRSALWLAQGLLIGSLLVLATQPPYLFMVLASVSLGLATGGMLPVWNAMMASTFGVESFGRAMGAMGPLITLSIMPGFAITGYLFDYSGSYTPAMLLFSATTFIAALLLIPLRTASPRD